MAAILFLPRHRVTQNRPTCNKFRVITRRHARHMATRAGEGEKEAEPGRGAEVPGNNCAIFFFFLSEEKQF